MKRGINRGALGKRLICSGSERAAKEFLIIDDLKNLWFRPFRDKLSVRRAKARSSSGCESHPATIAPADSNRSSRTGSEVTEAFGVEGHVGVDCDPARRKGRPTVETSLPPPRHISTPPCSQAICQMSGDLKTSLLGDSFARLESNIIRAFRVFDAPKPTVVIGSFGSKG